MAQKLALPLNTCEINAGYKEYAPGYELSTGPATHYGVDFIGSTFSGNDKRFFASGVGVVLGVNNTYIPDEHYTVGRWVAIKYTNVEGYGDLVARYYHMSRVDVSVGDYVDLDTIRIELDTDTQYWQYTPTLIGYTTCGLCPGNRGAGDTTVNPLSVLKRKISPPENQTCTVENDGKWCDNITIPGWFR